MNLILVTDSCHTQDLLFPFRSVIWMQKRREDVMERLRGTSQRREDQHEMQIGRLKQDRVRVPRDEDVCIYNTCVATN